MKKYLLILSLALLATACGPQLTAKEKEDQQAKAYYEDDIKTLSPFIGHYKGKAYMKRTGSYRDVLVTITPFISSAAKNKAAVQLTFSLYEDYAKNPIPFYDATYFSSEAVGGTLYLTSGGATGAGGVNGAGASITISENGNELVMDGVLVRLEVKRVKDKKR